MKSMIISLRLLLCMTFITGILYPCGVTLYGNLFVKDKAAGSLIQLQEKKIGSLLIGQKFSAPQYFWSRPSAIDYNSQLSGASNLGPTSAALKKIVEERRKSLLFDGVYSEIPQDLLFASASGLDPHISPDAAFFQVQRIANTRQIDVKRINDLVESLIELPQYGFLGDKRINVLKLNLALDKLNNQIGKHL